ncbi:MAG: class I SAM-dependent methyltransferase [Nitrospirota bacterium]
MHQDIRNKRGEIEWHKIAVLGEPEKVLTTYRERNDERRKLFNHYKDQIKEFSPFLEIGANAAYTSYMLANEWSCDGIAIDISEDALKAGVIIKDNFGYSRSPLRVCCDAGKIPLKDNSIKFVFAFQTLHHFIDPTPVIKEIKRVLVDGGIFLFADEPVKRRLSLNLYRTRREDSFNRVEKLLKRAGLLRYISEAYFGSREETIFGIMENQKITLRRWIHMLKENFREVSLDYSGVYAMGRDVRLLTNLLSNILPLSMAERIAADLMGCSLKGICRVKKGQQAVLYNPEKFVSSLLCPDCHGDLTNDKNSLLCLSCGYVSYDDLGIFNMLSTKEKEALYGSKHRKQVVFADNGHEEYLGEGWHTLEGNYTNKYRWTSKEAKVYLMKDSYTEAIRICGYIPSKAIETHKKIKIEVFVNQAKIGEKTIRKMGNFIFEKRMNLNGNSPLPIEIKLAVDKTLKSGDIEYGVIISYIKLIQT